MKKELIAVVLLGLALPAAIAALIVLVGMVDRPVDGRFNPDQTAIVIGALVMFLMALAIFMGLYRAVEEYREGIERRKKNEEPVEIVLDFETSVDKFNVQGYQRFDEKGTVSFQVNDDIRDKMADNRYTCFDCEDRFDCEYAFDDYNVNGDCLALK